MSIELMQSGYIGSISYKGQNANIDVGSAYSKSFPPTEKSWCVSLPLQARAPRRLTGPTAWGLYFSVVKSMDFITVQALGGT